LLHPHPPVHAPVDLREVERLHEHGAVEEAEAIVLGAVLHDVGGDEGDAVGERGAVLEDPVVELEARAVVEPEVDEDAVVVRGLEAAARVGDRARRLDAGAAPREPALDGAGHGGVVVDVEDRGHAAGWRAGTGAGCELCRDNTWWRARAGGGGASAGGRRCRAEAGGADATGPCRPCDRRGRALHGAPFPAHRQ
jgi:hypothetical protein